ncbi:hypothetical protein RB595_001456 [Gaeumannomyces hyphopodioides]
MCALKLSTVCEPLSPRDLPCFDIVLVHDFGGDAVRQWEPLWPPGGRPKELPDARVLSFGYNEISYHPYGREELSSPAERLLWELRQERRGEDTRLRPLVFVGRGAGGFIIKKALIAARLEVQYRDILSLTAGVVFFDTPHQAGPGGWGNIVVEMYKKSPLYRELKIEASSDMLRGDDVAALTELSEAFIEIPGLLLITNTSLVTKGQSHIPKVMNFKDAGLEESPSPEFLLGLTEAIRREAPKRQNEGMTDEHHQVLQMLRSHKVRRENMPNPATPGTCFWIEEKPQFKKWWDRVPERRLLWIRGEMGCGKTYLARHIRQLLEDRKTSSPVLAPLPETVAYCSLQDLMEAHRTPQGIVAWLLHDVLIARPELMGAAKLGTRPVCDFTVHDSQKLWDSVVAEATKEGCLTFVIDEAEQVRIEDYIMDSFLKTLACRDLSETTSGRVRVLVLSRHEERLESMMGACGFSRYDITPQDTQPDIEKTAEEVLKVIERFPGGSAVAENFGKQIKEGANGMYLWARLALDEAVKTVAPGGRKGERLAEGIFPLFDQLLGQFISAPGGSNHDLADPNFRLNLLFWVTYQATPMRDEEMLVACAMVKKVKDIKELKWVDAVVDDDDDSGFHQYRPNMRRDVLNHCSPLVRIEPDGRIVPVHRSLPEYLATPKEALPEQPPLPHHAHFHCDYEKAHTNISSLCMDYLLQPALEGSGLLLDIAVKRDGERGPSPEDEELLGEVVADFRFLRYAALFWIYHVGLAGKPLDAEGEHWNTKEAQRLLAFGGQPPNETAPGWVRVLWVASQEGEDFPRSFDELSALFPNEQRRINDVGWSEAAVRAASAAAEAELGGAAREEEMSLAWEIEAALAGLMGWMGQLQLDIGVKIKTDEKIIEDLRNLKGMIDTGTIDDDEARRLMEELRRQVETAKGEARIAKADFERINKEHTAMEARCKAMEKAMQDIRESLRRSKGLLADQKGTQRSWNPFRRPNVAGGAQG